jgi:hypothetical protein
MLSVALISQNGSESKGSSTIRDLNTRAVRRGEEEARERRDGRGGGGERRGWRGEEAMRGVEM